MTSHSYTIAPTARARFLRYQLERARLQAAFNRSHYSDTEALCWDLAAADALAALGGIASDWQNTTWGAS